MSSTYCQGDHVGPTSRTSNCRWR